MAQLRLLLLILNSSYAYDYTFLVSSIFDSLQFGMSYYGCCEAVDDRFTQIQKARPNLRSFSVSGRNDFEKVAEMVGKDYVYCRKPTPAHISNAGDWALMEKDLDITYNATMKHGCTVELIVRDVYDVGGDMKRLPQWVELAKKKFGI